MPNFHSFDLSDRGNLWDEDDEFPRSDWAEEASNADTHQGYWAWVFHERQEAAEDEESPFYGREGITSKSDALRAIKEHSNAQNTVCSLLSDLLNKNDPIYWYTERGGKFYRQDGRIHNTMIGSLDTHVCIAINTRTGRMVWLSLYDLRFWLNDVHPTNQ